MNDSNPFDLPPDEFERRLGLHPAEPLSSDPADQTPAELASPTCSSNDARSAGKDKHGSEPVTIRLLPGADDAKGIGPGTVPEWFLWLVLVVAVGVGLVFLAGIVLSFWFGAGLLGLAALGFALLYFVIGRRIADGGASEETDCVLGREVRFQVSAGAAGFIGALASFLPWLVFLVESALGLVFLAVGADFDAGQFFGRTMPLSLIIACIVAGLLTGVIRELSSW